MTEPSGQDKLTALHDRLASEVAALVSGDDWRSWLDVARHFPTYSFNNCLLIAAQRPEATAVAGYRAWQTLGRHVDRGEHGIQILAPVRRRVLTATDDRKPPVDVPGEDARVSRVTGFVVAHVWDVEQTSGEPLPERPSPTLLVGNAPVGLWDSLSDLLRQRGFTLERGDCGQANGWTDHAGRTVRVRSDVDEAQAVKTLVHEVAHVLLHDRDAASPTLPCRGVAEVEAESVTYLVAASHGLTTDEYSFAYVTGWAEGIDGLTAEEVVRQTGQRVLTAAREVLTAVGAIASHEVSSELSAQVSDVQDQISLVSEAAVVTVGNVRRSAAPGSSDSIASINAEASAFFVASLQGSAEAATALGDRGVGDDAAAAYELGYAPASWTALTDHLRGCGFSDEQLAESGVTVVSRRGSLVDRFRDRMTFSIRDPSGVAVIGFIGRSLHPDDRNPKYLNSPGTLLYSKSDVLYGLGFACVRGALAGGATPVIVEGAFDAIAVTMSSGGRYAGVAPSGTALTAGQVAALAGTHQLAGRDVIVAFDGDIAGQLAAVRSFALLTGTGCRPMAAGLPTGQDPASLAQADPHTLMVVLEAAVPLADVVVDHQLAHWDERIRWPEGRVGAARAVSGVIAALPPDQVGRQVARVAARLRMDPADVTREVLCAMERGVRASCPVRGSEAASAAALASVAVRQTEPVVADVCPHPAPSGCASSTDLAAVGQRPVEPRERRLTH